LPGLTRQSIALQKMDARVKPGHDERVLKRAAKKTAGRNQQ
jgi:hypothetical protein